MVFRKKLRSSTFMARLTGGANISAEASGADMDGDVVRRWPAGANLQKILESPGMTQGPGNQVPCSRVSSCRLQRAVGRNSCYLCMQRPSSSPPSVTPHLTISHPKWVGVCCTSVGSPDGWSAAGLQGFALGLKKLALTAIQQHNTQLPVRPPPEPLRVSQTSSTCHEVPPIPRMTAVLDPRQPLAPLAYVYSQP